MPTDSEMKSTDSRRSFIMGTYTFRTIDVSYHRWTFRTVDVLYHGFFVPSLDFSYPSYHGLFVPSLDVSYHRWAARCAWNSTTLTTSHNSQPYLLLQYALKSFVLTRSQTMEISKITTTVRNVQGWYEKSVVRTLNTEFIETHWQQNAE